MRRRSLLRWTALAPIAAVAAPVLAGLPARHLAPSWRLGYALAFDQARGLFVRVRP